MTHTDTSTAPSSSAQLCRDNGWGPGTRLVGDEGYGPTVIEITAVGRSGILAVSLSHDGRPRNGDTEMMWTLFQRDWKVVNT